MLIVESAGAIRNIFLSKIEGNEEFSPLLLHRIALVQHVQLFLGSHGLSNCAHNKKTIINTIRERNLVTSNDGCNEWTRRSITLSYLIPFSQ